MAQPFQQSPWYDHPSGGTPTGADRFNDLEGRIFQGVEDAVERAIAHGTTSPGDGIYNVLHLAPFGLANFKRDSLGGASGTDNTAAFNALINFVQASLQPVTKTGAVIVFPPGGYRIDGPVNFPTGGQAFVLAGAGRGGTRTQNDTNPQRITRFRRVAGGKEMLLGALDNVNLDRNPVLEIRGIDFDGGKDIGLVHQPPMLRLPIGAEFRMRDCKFQSNDGVGMSIAQPLNADMSGVRFHNCGSAWVDPADVWGTSGLVRSPACSFAFTALGGANTMRLTDMEFEANNGDDFLLNGSGAASSANIILCENWKMEGFGDGGAYPYIRLLYGYQVDFSNLEIIQHRPAPAIYQEGGHSGDGSNFPLMVNHITGGGIHCESSVSPYAIDHLGGGLNLEQFRLSAQPGFLPSTAWIHRHNTVEASSYKYNVTYDDAAPLVASP